MAGAQPLPGWTPWSDPNNGDPSAVAKWAVKEYDLLTGNKLELQSVTSCATYELPNIKAKIWNIDLQARGSTTSNCYRAYVWQKLEDSTTHNHLTYFGNPPK